MTLPIEEEYGDIFFNIESAIASVYQSQPELTDYNVDAALESLGRTYALEGRGKAPQPPKNPLAVKVYDEVKFICDWRLGREKPVDETGQPLSIDPVGVDVILAILKKLRKSVQYWNRESGSQGYLNYIRQFLPGSPGVKR